MYDCVHKLACACHICNWLPQLPPYLAARPLIFWKSGISGADLSVNQLSNSVLRNVNLCTALEAGISPQPGFNRSRNPFNGKRYMQSNLRMVR